MSCKTQAAFSVSHLFPDDFAITHYAGKVSYNVNGFMDRNKDTVPEDMRELLAGSENPLLAQIFARGTYATGGTEAEELLAGKREVITNALLLDLADDADMATEARAIRDKREAAAANAEEAAREPAVGAAKAKRRQSFMLAETVTMKFKSQLGSLMDTITTTEVGSASE